MSWLKENFLTFSTVESTMTSHFSDSMTIIISSFNYVNYDLHHQTLECNFHNKMLKLCYSWKTSNRVLIFVTVFKKWLIVMWKLCNHQISKCNTSWLNYMIDLLTDNKWIAVICNALMKALAITFSWIATVKVTDKFTSKHYDLQCDTDFVNRHHDVKRWSVMLFKQRKFWFDINDWLSWQILIELWRYILYFYYELIYSSWRTFSV